MNKRILPLIGAFLIELVLLLLFGLLALFSISYFVANINVWTDYSVLQYASDGDRFWMFLFLTSDAMLYVILGLLFLEVGLLLIRTSGKVVFKAIEQYSGTKQTVWFERWKKISLLTLIKLVKLNTLKKGLIAYFAVIAVMLLSGWVGKQALVSRDALVYRTFETKNLYSELDAPDFAAEIETDVVYDIQIEAGVGNVHLYQVSGTTEAKIYLLYDEEIVLTEYELTIDRDNHSIQIRLNNSQLSYAPYVDLVLPSVELYLPDGLMVGDVTIDVATYGTVSVDFLSFETIAIDMKGGELYLRQNQDQIAKSIAVSAEDAKVTIQIDRVELLALTLSGSRANVRVRIVDTTLTLIAEASSDLFFYQASIAQFNATIADSIVELREVYATTTTLEVTNASLIYVNGVAAFPYGVFDLESVNSTINTRGTPDDSAS
jgi:hypothetical protein